MYSSDEEITKLETRDHIFIHCLFSSYFRFKTQSIEGVGSGWGNSEMNEVLFAIDLGCELGRMGRDFWMMVVHCICWPI